MIQSRPTPWGTHGSTSEREARLQARVAALEAEVTRLRRQVILLETTFVPGPQRTENWRDPR